MTTFRFLCLQLLLICIGGMHLFAPLFQSESQCSSSFFASSAIAALQRQFGGFPAEKIFVRTDRSAYTAGDTVWMKAWVQHGSLLTPTTHSARLYIELIDNLSTVIQRKLCRIEYGESSAYFVLPEGVKERSIFRIRAYTPRMVAYFDPGYPYEFRFPVVVRGAPGEIRVADNRIYQVGVPLWEQPQLTKAQIEKVSAAERERAEAEERAWLEAKKAGSRTRLKEIDLQFLPEGGCWVEGLPCRMAFKAVASDGFGIDVEGVVVDDLGNEWISFASQRLGMGSFLLLPMPGRTYTAVLFNGQRIALPAPREEGITLQWGRMVNDSVELRIFASQGILDQGDVVFELIGEARGAFALSMPVRLVKAGNRYTIPLHQFPEGIARFSLFAQDGSVIAERLVWIERDEQLHISVSGSLMTDEKGEKSVVLNLHSCDSDGNPIPSSLTVSVTDVAGMAAPPSSESLCTRMLLTSDLRGEIEDPGWYFLPTLGEPDASARLNRFRYPFDAEKAEALDLVLLTHGWRGFDWDTLLSKQPDAFPDLWPGRWDLRGKVTNLLNRGVANESVLLFAQDESSLLIDKRVTDEEGRFVFPALLFEGNSLVRLQTMGTDSKINRKGIVCNPQPAVPVPDIHPIAQRIDKSFLDSLFLAFRAVKQFRASQIDSLHRLQGVEWLEEVAVTGVQRMKHANGNEKAGLQIEATSLQQKYDPGTKLLQILQKEIPGFGVNDQYYGLNEIIVSENYDYLFAREDRAVKGGYLTLNREAGFDSLSYIREIKDILQQNYTINGTFVDFYIDGIYLQEQDKELYNFKVEASEPVVEEESGHISRHEKRASKVVATRNLQSIARTMAFDELFKELTAKLESVTAMEILHIAVSLNSERGATIEVKTRSGRGPMARLLPGVIFSQIEGFTNPGSFYVPKFYPREVIDQIAYDHRFTYLWNPNLLTDAQGQVRLSFPAGFWPGRSFEVVAEGTDRAGRHGFTRVTLTIP